MKIASGTNRPRNDKYGMILLPLYLLGVGQLLNTLSKINSGERYGLEKPTQK
jgi:hypothetical protein